MASVKQDLRNTSNESKTKGLLDLPPELVEEIVRWLPCSELPSLRLVCKDLNEISFALFGEAFFSERVFILSDESSMNALKGISNSQRLAKCVRHINFSASDIECYRAERIVEYMIMDLEDDLEDDIKDECEPSDEREREEFHFVFKALLSIFENFNYLGLSPKVSFQDRDVDDEENEPKHLKSSLRLNDHEGIQTCRDPLYHIVWYKALARSGYAASELDIGQNDAVLPLSCFCYQPHQICVAKLRVLRIRVWPFCNSDFHYKTVVQDFAMVMAKAPNLEQLTLHLENEGGTLDLLGTYDPWQAVFHALATKCHLDGTSLNLPHQGPIFPKLEYLELENHIINFDLLLRFCRERKDTLKKVALGHVIDSEKVHPNVVRNQIQEAVQGGQDGEVEVVLYDLCYGWDQHQF